MHDANRGVGDSIHKQPPFVSPHTAKRRAEAPGYDMAPCRHVEARAPSALMFVLVHLPDTLLHSGTGARHTTKAAVPKQHGAHPCGSNSLAFPSVVGALT